MRSCYYGGRGTGPKCQAGGGTKPKTPAHGLHCSFPGENARSWEALGEARPVGFPDNSVGKESACNAGDPGLIPGSGRSPGEGRGYPLQPQRRVMWMWLGAFPGAFGLGQSGGAPALRPGAIAQSPGREAALAWASLAQRSPASSVLAREGRVGHD